MSVDSVPYGTVLGWARSRAYDTSPWYSDRQYLVRGDRGTLQVGPMARIAGLLDAHLMTPESMSEGRFIGRIESEGNAEEMGIVRGTTYVWIDDEDGDGRWRALLFPEWEHPPAILRPTLESFDTLAGGVLHARQPLVFEARMNVFVLPGFICNPSMARGAFWSQGDRSGFDSPELLMDAGSVLMACVPCDCRICCMQSPVAREHGGPFPEGRRPVGGDGL